MGVLVKKYLLMVNMGLAKRDWVEKHSMEW